jgi:hypothetical protein
MSNWNALAEFDPLWTILSAREKKFGKSDPRGIFQNRGTGSRWGAGNMQGQTYQTFLTQNFLTLVAV